MLLHITKNRRAKPLKTLEVIVNLIAYTTTQMGLIIKAKADKMRMKKELKLMIKQYRISI